MYGLDGQVALVTGAGGEHGIGRAIAVRLAAEGATVVVNDLTEGGCAGWGGVAAVVAEVEATGRRAVAATGDVSNAEDVQRMVDRALAAFGRIDILVNNAGAPAGPDRVPLVELDEAAFDKVQAVNVKGTFLCCRTVARHMIDRGDGGKIINISSIAGKRGVAKFAAYCASKFAVIGLTQSLAHELGPHKINVNAICPGLVDTERVYGIAEAIKPDDQSVDEMRTRMIARATKANPLGRVAQGEDIARTAAWLASPESDYLTGQAINVGGALM